MNAPVPIRDTWYTRKPTDVIGLADECWTIAQRIAGTEFVPKSMRNRPEAVLAALLSGAERGLGPMESLRSVHVIEGVPSLSSEAMRALVFAAGHDIQILETTATKATVVGRRAGADTTSPEFTWTMDRARRARLANRPNWQAYPEAMLLARASADMCRAWFPDVVAGLAIAEVVADESDTEPATTTTRRRKGTPPARKSVGADAIRPALAPADDVAPATDPLENLEPVPEPEHVTPDEVLEPIPGEDRPLWSDEPEPEPDPEPEPEPVPPAADATLARKIHAQIAEAFPDADGITRDRYRHALVAVATRARDDGPVTSSTALNTEEQLRLSDILVKVRGGQATVATGPDDTVELRAGGGWMYVVALDPVEVAVHRGEP